MAGQFQNSGTNKLKHRRKLKNIAYNKRSPVSDIVIQGHGRSLVISQINRQKIDFYNLDMVRSVKILKSMPFCLANSDAALHFETFLTYSFHAYESLGSAGSGDLV